MTATNMPGNAPRSKSRDRASRFGDHFKTDKRGNVAMIFGIALVPLTLFAGSSVDYARASRASSQLQAAADAAVLSTSRSGASTNSEREQRATEYFAANVAANPLLAGTVPSVTATNVSVNLTARAKIPTAFMRVAGIDFIPVSVRSGVIYKGRKIELSLMTDTTGSMAEVRNGGAKIDGLKLAAADLLNIILPDGMPEEKARVALVPFANYVNAGEYAPVVTGLAGTKTQSNVTQTLVTCVTERNGHDDYTDAAPTNGSYVGSFGQGNSGNNYSADGVCYRNNGGNPLPAIMPLTNDKTALLATINSFTPAGTTAGHLGTAWAWYMLAPSWNSVWALSTPPAAYDDEKVFKAAVLMTDGFYNTQYTSTESRQQALSLCTAMKAAGVTVYTVGLGFAPSTSDPQELAAKDTLTQCASGSGHYFFPYDGDALRTAFTQIGQQVTTAAGTAMLSN